MTRCPSEADLLRFADGALSVEETEDARSHVEQCAPCGARVKALRTLFADLSAVDVPPFDARDHARAVRAKIERLERDGRNAHGAGESRRRSTRVFAWVAWALPPAALAFVGFLAVRTPASGSWQARGGADPRADLRISRDVGVQIYAAGPVLRPLSAGAVIAPDTPMTAGFRNLGPSPSYLLLFAVDERHIVHWISPAFRRREDDPPSTALPTAIEERALPTTAVLEDVPFGPLRLIAVITSTPAHVADIEALEGSAVTAERIERILPDAEVRETRVEVARASANEGGRP